MKKQIKAAKIKYQKSTLFQGIVKVFSGNVIIQIIGFLTIPIIARLYSPSDLGIRDLFAGVLGILGMISTLNFESAIVLSTTDDDARIAFNISLIIVIFYIIIISVFFMFFSEKLLVFLNAEALLPFIHVLIICVFLKSLVQLGRQIMIRNKLYGRSVLSNFLETTSIRLMTAGLGFYIPTISVLLYTYVSGFLMTIGYLIKKTGGFLRVSERHNRKDYRRIFDQHKKLILVNTPNSFISSFSQRIPVFIMAAFFGPAILAIYGYGEKIINLPVNLISNSIGQVFFSEISSRKDKRKYYQLYKKMVLRLFLLGLVGFILILLLAKPAVYILLGDKWLEVIPVIRILALLAVFSMTYAPLSSILTIVGKQEINLFFTIFEGVVKLTSMLLFSKNFLTIIAAYSISTSLCYALFVLYTMGILKRVSKETNQS